MNLIPGVVLILIVFVVIVRQIERGDALFTRVIALGIGLYLGYLLLSAGSFSWGMIFMGGIVGLLLLYGIGGNPLLARFGIKNASQSSEPQTANNPEIDYFVPQFIYEQYDAEEMTGSFTAVALVLGISGFHNIPRLYSDPDGEDKLNLTGMADHLFTPVIATIYAHGGFVANYYGHVLIALFPGNDPLPVIEVARAVRDCLYRPNNKLFSVNQGIAMGQVSWKIHFPPPWVFSRQPSQQYYTFEGAVTTALDAAQIGQPGDIIMAHALTKILPKTVETAAIGAGNYHHLMGLQTIEPGAVPQIITEPIPENQQADYHRVLALMLNALGLHNEAIEQYDQAATAAEAAKNPRTRATALLEQTTLYSDGNNIMKVSRLLTEATEIRRRADDPNGLQRQTLIGLSNEDAIVHTFSPTGAYQTWSLPEWRLIETKSLEQATSQAVSMDRKLLVTSQGKEISCWRTGESVPFSQFSVPYQPQQIFIHPQNLYLAIVNQFEFNETVRDRESFPFVQIRSCQTGQLIHTIEIWLPLIGCITDLACVDPEWQFISIGLRYLAPYEWDRTRLYVCPLDQDYTLKHNGMQRYQGTTMTAMAFSQDDQFLAIAISDSGRYPDAQAGFKLHLWSNPKNPSGKEVHYKQAHWLAGHQERINWLLFNETQQTLLSGSADQTINIWGLPEGALLHTMHGHEGAVLCGLLHPDGMLLATGDEKGSIAIWQLDGGVLVYKVQAFETAVSALALSPDDAYIISVSIDGIPNRHNWQR